MKTPDITPAQILALATFLAGELIAWGLVSSSREQLIISISSTVIAVALKISDAILRHGRARIAAVTAVEQLLLEAAVKPSTAG